MRVVERKNLINPSVDHELKSSTTDHLQIVPVRPNFYHFIGSVQTADDLLRP